MMLLPLIDHAISRDMGQGNIERTLHIASGTSGGRLRIEIVDSGAGFALDAGRAGMANIRERLTALYGKDASLVLRECATGSTGATLELSHEAFQEMASGQESVAGSKDPLRQLGNPAQLRG